MEQITRKSDVSTSEKRASESSAALKEDAISTVFFCENQKEKPGEIPALYSSVSVLGFEPRTFGLKGRCSTN